MRRGQRCSAKGSERGRRIAEGFKGGGVAEGQGIPDQIRHLARLRDEGHINNKEFEYKKRELLKCM